MHYLASWPYAGLSQASAEMAEIRPQQMKWASNEEGIVPNYTIEGLKNFLRFKDVLHFHFWHHTGIAGEQLQLPHSSCSQAMHICHQRQKLRSQVHHIPTHENEQTKPKDTSTSKHKCE